MQNQDLTLETEDGLPGLIIHIDEAFVAMNASVVHQDVDPFEPLEDRISHLQDLRRIADISLKGLSRSPLPFDCLRHRLGRSLVPLKVKKVNGHIGPLLGHG
jgi:hypothetical protein